jgi:hypothetical protein
LLLQCSLVTNLEGFSEPERSGPDTGAASGSEGGGEGGLLPGDVELVDDSDNDFGAGTLEGTSIAGGAVALAGTSAGRFVSRVHDAGREVQVVSFQWTPEAPYRKPMPDNGAAETGYSRDGLDMRDNVLLYHFDDVSQPTVASVADLSGKAHHATARGAGTIALLDDGIVGGGFRDVLETHLATAVSDGSLLNFGESSLTWSLWARSTQDCPDSNPPSGNRVYLGYDDMSGDETHLWLGCQAPTDACENAHNGAGRAGGTWCSRKGPQSDCRAFCGRTRINDGNWHHLAVTKQGHASSKLRLFVDGALDAPELDAAFGTPIAVTPGIDFTLGAFTGGTYKAVGDFDEVAVFRRELSSEEITAIYRRGALDMTLRVRVCTQPDCSDAPPFVGPSPSAAAFSDHDGTLAPPGPRPVEASGRGRYVQYEAQLTTLHPSQTPRLLTVRIHARP